MNYVTLTFHMDWFKSFRKCWSPEISMHSSLSNTTWLADWIITWTSRCTCAPNKVDGQCKVELAICLSYLSCCKVKWNWTNSEELSGSWTDNILLKSTLINVDKSKNNSSLYNSSCSCLETPLVIKRAVPLAAYILFPQWLLDEVMCLESWVVLFFLLPSFFYLSSFL